MSKGSPAAVAIRMSIRQYELLHHEGNRRNCSRSLYHRIQILLQASEGISNKGISRDLGVSLGMVKRWRYRWESSYEKLLSYEKGADGLGISNHTLLLKLLDFLKDKPRSGAPVVISIAQKQQIVALACENPEDYGIERTEWTLSSLSQVAIKLSIVESISSAYVGRILKNERIATA